VLGILAVMEFNSLSDFMASLAAAAFTSPEIIASNVQCIPVQHSLKRHSTALTLNQLRAMPHILKGL
jgi:hypothetical protein